MAFTDHTQKSTTAKVWAGVYVTDPGGGDLEVSEGHFWLHGVDRTIAAYSTAVGTAVFRLWIESDGAGGAQLLLDTTMAATPVAFSDGPAFLLAWRDIASANIHRIIHDRES